MRNMKKMAAATALAVVIAVGAPMAASAGTAYTNYSVTIGKLGGNGYTANQTKTGSSTAGNVKVTFVGNNFTVGASMMKSDNSQEGTKRYNLGAGYSATLPNSIASSSSVKMKMWGNPTWVVAVQADGTWRSN